MSTDSLLIARRAWLPEGRWLEPAALWWSDGRIQAVGAPAELRDRARAARNPSVIECADHVVLPGLVNAHAHLELSGLRTARAADGGFLEWVKRVIAARARVLDADLAAAARRGARRALCTGTTTVGDLDGSGVAERALEPAADLPRIVVHRELLDGGSQGPRTAAALARLNSPAASGGGLAVHAAHTVSKPLLVAIARAASARDCPVQVHWSETPEEVDWLERGIGPFASLLAQSPLRTALDLLAEVGLLGPRLALVHGNVVREGERARVAAAGARLVHCPGSHAFFDRGAFDLRAWMAAGVDVALGSDSLASNEDLDMRRELRLFCAAHPWLDAPRAWDAATRHSARALGLAGQVGELRAGASADLLIAPAAPEDAARPLERFVRAEFELSQVWRAGRRVDLAAIAGSADVFPGCASEAGNPG